MSSKDNHMSQTGRHIDRNKHSARDIFNALVPDKLIRVNSDELVWQVMFVWHVAVVTQVKVVTHGALPAHTKYVLLFTHVTCDVPVIHTWDNIQQVYISAVTAAPIELFTGRIPCQAFIEYSSTQLIPEVASRKYLSLYDRK